ncbi:MAG: methyltransferase domain-containing protein [Pseudomonadota bacterium]
MADKADWTGDLGAEWAKRADVMERMLDPFGTQSIGALGIIAKSKVLDLGCGGGSSTFRLARKVGVRGAVVGVDVSPDLIALAAARRAAGKGSFSRAGFLLADAAAEGVLPESAFDALHSQFGAMFFDQPTAAYVNIRKALKPGARVSIVCWRGPKENSWAMAAMDAARPYLPPIEPPPKFAPGPFAWSAPEETFKRYLRDAGFGDVRCRGIDRSIPLGLGLKGETPLDRAVKFCMKIGPLASRMKGLGKPEKAEIKTAVRAALSGLEKNGRIMATGACWLVTAKA